MSIVLDSNKLTEILLQRPVDMRGPSIGSKRLTDAELAYMQAQAKRHFDVVLDTLEQMPRNMLFVIRFQTIQFQPLKHLELSLNLYSFSFSFHSFCE